MIYENCKGCRIRPQRAIVDCLFPAIQKHNELKLIKAREPKITSADDFIEDKGME
jgi:hypothetical protein